MRVPTRRSEKNNKFEFDPHITQEKYQKLKNKLNYLKQEHKKAKQEMALHACDGDFSENEPYKAAKRKLRSLNTQTKKTEDALKYAVIIKGEKSEKVQIGNKVKLKNLDTQEIKEYKVLGSQESNPDKGIISHNSPLGTKLLGKKLKEVIELKTPNRVKRYEIIEIN